MAAVAQRASAAISRSQRRELRRRAPQLRAMMERAGDTPLTEAARRGSAADVVALLAGGADVNEPKTDGSGATALFLACCRGRPHRPNANVPAQKQRRHAAQNRLPVWLAEVVTALTRERRREPGQQRGRHAAVRRLPGGPHRVVAKLIAANANVNQAENDGVTPLLIACQKGHTEIVTKLIAANADVNQANNNGATPLYVACQNGRAEVVTKLIAANADVNQADNDGVTPLYIACQNGHTEIVAKLIAANANVDQANEQRRHAAVHRLPEGPHRGRHELLAANADVNQATNDGATPLYAACQKGHTEVVTKLLAANACREAVASRASRRCSSPARTATPRSSRSCSPRTPT